MANEYIIAAIGITGTLLGTVSGFFSTILYDRIREKSRLKSEVKAAINEILFVLVVNEYPVVMNKLRRLIVANAEAFANNESITFFYKKWLNNPVLHFDKPIANLYTQEQIKELTSDLSRIRL